MCCSQRTALHGSGGGYRLFASQTLEKLALIHALQTMDVTIADLARILKVRRNRICSCEILKESIDTKMARIEARINELNALKSQLNHFY